VRRLEKRVKTILREGAQDPGRRMTMGIIEKVFWWLPFGRVPEIEAEGLAARCDGATAPQILDVRTRREWR
jgi:hypothetical protein